MVVHKYGVKGKHPLVGWCESGDHLLASCVGILRLMPANDLPPRTTQLGVFSFKIMGIYAGVVSLDCKICCNSVMSLRAASAKYHNTKRDYSQFHRNNIMSRQYTPWLQSLIARFMGPIWGRQDPGGPHVGPMNFAIWDVKQKEVWLNIITRGKLYSNGIFVSVEAETSFSHFQMHFLTEMLFLFVF